MAVAPVWQPVLPGLWTATGSCSSYLIASRSGSVLIDCGVHITPNSALPAGAVQAVLLNHFHRDQCDAAAAWAREGVPVWVPAAEQRLFMEIDLVRGARDGYNDYTSLAEEFGQ